MGLGTVQQTISRTLGRPVTLALVGDIVGEAVEWIGECEWQDIDRAAVDHLTAAEAISVVQRHYAGGLAGFLADGLYR